MRSTIRIRRSEAGIALLISIFVLLLISVVAIALIVSSGTESALAGNYRSATSVYYAALAGLEEGRGRLVPKNPNSFKNTDAAFLPSPGITLAIGQVRYITNPVGTEDVLAAYPDNEYAAEFGSAPVLSNVRTTASVSGAGGVQGPLYKWVRINAVPEQWLGHDAAPYDGILDPTPLFYDGTNLNDTNSGAQVLEITALAALPNGSQKLVQYLTAPTPLSLTFPSALTLDGNGVIFNTTTSDNFFVKGNDQYSALSCNPSPPAAPVTALGYTNSGDSTIVNAIPPGPPVAADRRGNYTNLVDSTPDVYQVTFSPNLTSVAGLNSLVQTITQNADVPPITPSGQLTDSNDFMPSAMSSTNPMTIVINGDLTFNGWHHHGYGLLLVTGKLTYDPDAFWHGIILVIGKGWFFANQGSSTGGHIEGALFIAKTTDSSGNPLPIGSPLGASRFDFTSNSLTPSGSNYYGVYYSNCWIQAAMPNLGYKIISFHEISQ